LHAARQIDAARADLISCGVEVSPLFHLPENRGARKPGRDPENRSYRTYAVFKDPWSERLKLLGRVSRR
jgi:hypothetical protein